MNAIFYQNEEERKLALETSAKQEKLKKAKIATKILPLGKFYLAEDYHQKYYMKLRSPFYKEFQAIYSKKEDFMASTAVARVNAYLGGYGSIDQLMKEVNLLGLSDSAQQSLINIVKSRRPK